MGRGGGGFMPEDMHNKYWAQEIHSERLKNREVRKGGREWWWKWLVAGGGITLLVVAFIAVELIFGGSP